MAEFKIYLLGFDFAQHGNQCLNAFTAHWRCRKGVKNHIVRRGNSGAKLQTIVTRYRDGSGSVWFRKKNRSIADLDNSAKLVGLFCWGYSGSPRGAAVLRSSARRHDLHDIRRSNRGDDLQFRTWTWLFRTSDDCALAE